MPRSADKALIARAFNVLTVLRWFLGGRKRFVVLHVRHDAIVRELSARVRGFRRTKSSHDNAPSLPYAQRRRASSVPSHGRPQSVANGTNVDWATAPAI